MFFKRNAAVLLVAGLVLTGGAYAWAQGAPERPSLGDPATRDAARACRDQAKGDRSAGERPTAEQRETMRRCLEAAGVDKRPGAGHDRRHKRPGDGFLHRAIHGDLVVRNAEGGFDHVTYDRGTVEEATTAERLVLKRADGETVRVALTDETKYKGVENAEGLQDGKGVMVVHQDGKALVVAQALERPGSGQGPGQGPGPSGNTADSATVQNL